MKIFIFADGKVAEEVIKFLKINNEEIVGIILHSPSKQNNTKQILDIVDLPKENIFTWGELSEEELCKKINELNPDIGLSIFWTYILTQNIYFKLATHILFSNLFWKYNITYPRAIEMTCM